VKPLLDSVLKGGVATLEFSICWRRVLDGLTLLYPFLDFVELSART
jgi:hypothetical protein